MLPRAGPAIQASLLVNLGCGVVDWDGEVVDEVVVEVGEELEVKVDELGVKIEDGARDKCQ
jgi:hypothetical protein